MKKISVIEIKKRKKSSVLKDHFPNLPFILFVFTLQKVMSDCRTVLDLGCGSLSPLRYINAEVYGLDAHKETILEAKNNRTHNKLIVLDVKSIRSHFKRKSFDAVVGLDLIEHLPKKDGLKLISDMEYLAAKKVIIFTPNGFMPQEGKHIFDKHLSGWDVIEMKKKRFTVYGMFGLKWLRGSEHKLRFKLFSAILSEISQWLFTFYYPQFAAAILCVKSLY
jgi:SAM-dependent methyltransferase